MEKEKTVLRNKSIGTKVSDEEYAHLEKLAEARGLTLSEWFRELALAELIAHPTEQVLLAEVLALRTILLNVLFGIANGEKLTAEEMRKLIEKADASKGEKARDKLTGKASGSRNGSQDGAR
jgi:hypothetical protein